MNRTCETEQTSSERTAALPCADGLYEAATAGFWVNDWLVEPDRHQVSLHTQQDGTQAPLCIRNLEPRLMKLLCRLAEQCNTVVSRDELINYLWPRVIVNENSLTRAVSDLRKALRHSPDSRVDIKTVPKRGYSLHAQVRLRSRNAASGQTIEHSRPDNTPDKPGYRHWWQQWWPTFTLPALLMAGVAALPGWQMTATSPTSANNQQLAAEALFDKVLQSPYTQAQTASANLDTMGLRLSPLLWQDAPSEGHPAAQAVDMPTLAVLSPERHIMAYVERKDDLFSLKLRPAFADAEPWTAFTTDETITSVQWSPLGDGVMFTVSSDVLEKDHTASQRLMLLDINTLALHELYRKPSVPNSDRLTRNGGNLT